MKQRGGTQRVREGGRERKREGEARRIAPGVRAEEGESGVVYAAYVEEDGMVQLSREHGGNGANWRKIHSFARASTETCNAFGSNIGSTILCLSLTYLIWTTV